MNRVIESGKDRTMNAEAKKTLTGAVPSSCAEVQTSALAVLATTINMMV